MLNAPVPATRKVLAKAGLSLDNIDLFEINEAFAVVAEKYIRDLKLDRHKVNVNGGAIALGHPIGATGAILIVTLLDELERRDLKRGLATMCAAGGMAPAIIVERAWERYWLLCLSELKDACRLAAAVSSGLCLARIRSSTSN
jgi:acetyl-CoA C-acetyltransferase